MRIRTFTGCAVTRFAPHDRLRRMIFSRFGSAPPALKAGSTFGRSCRRPGGIVRQRTLPIPSCLYPRPAESDPADAGELDCRPERIDTEYQAEQIEFDALLDADDHADESEQGDLESPSARSGGKQPAALQEVLADGDGGKIDFELGHPPCDPCRERVAVGTRPQPIYVGVGVGVHRIEDLRDRTRRGGSPKLLQEPWRLPVPIPIGQVG